MTRSKNKSSAKKKPATKAGTKFYHFSQNNSGGSFDFDKDAGITHHVVIEAVNVQDAVSRAERIGLYWDGCARGRDCSCCGDRWHEPWSDDGTQKPEVHGRPPLKNTWIKSSQCGGWSRAVKSAFTSWMAARTGTEHMTRDPLTLVGNFLIVLAGACVLFAAYVEMP